MRFKIPDKYVMKKTLKKDDYKIVIRRIVNPTDERKKMIIQVWVKKPYVTVYRKIMWAYEHHRFWSNSNSMSFVTRRAKVLVKRIKHNDKHLTQQI